MTRPHDRIGSAMLGPLLTLGNHDFCPWANRYVYWLKQPIGWFVVCAASASLIAAFLEPQAWIVVGSILAVMVLGVVWPWVAMLKTTAEIEFDCRRCREGDRVDVRLVVHNHWPWPLWGLAVENGFFIESTDASQRPVAALTRIAGWSRSQFSFEFRPAARGVYPQRPPELATGFPFGIWRAARPIHVQRELLVWPRTTALRAIPSLGGDIFDVIGMLFDRPGNEGDIIGVRPFRKGDRLRSIHWSQTARRQSLIVNERQAAARRLVVVAVDAPAFASAEAPRLGPLHPQLEIAIRVAASIAQEFQAHHADVRFLIGDLDLHLTVGRASLHRLLDALARFRHSPEKSIPPGSLSRKALAVVMTTSRHRTEWIRRAGKLDQLRLVLIENGAADRPLEQNGAESQPEAWRSAKKNVWFAIDAGQDCAQQLRRQWERVCHGSLAQ